MSKEKQNGRSSSRKQRVIERFNELRANTNSGRGDSTSTGTGEAGSTDRTVAGDSGGTGDTTGDTTDRDRDNQQQDNESGVESSISADTDSGVGFTVFTPDPSTAGGSTSRGRGRRSDRGAGNSNGNETEETKSVINSDVWSSPSIGFETIHGNTTGERKRRTRRTKQKTAPVELATGFQLLYSIPTFFLGDDHQHWQLDNDDAKDLSDAFVNALGASENKNFTKLLKMIEKYIPMLALLSIVYMLTKPRIEQSVRKINASKRTEREVSNVVNYPFTHSGYSSTPENISETTNTESHTEHTS